MVCSRYFERIICFSFIAPIGIAAGIIGLLYGLKGRKTEPEEKSSTTGIILSSAGLVLSILGIIGFFIMLTIVFYVLREIIYNAKNDDSCYAITFNN